MHFKRSFHTRTGLKSSADPTECCQLKQGSNQFSFNRSCVRALGVRLNECVRWQSRPKSFQLLIAPILSHEEPWFICVNRNECLDHFRTSEIREIRAGVSLAEINMAIAALGEQPSPLSVALGRKQRRALNSIEAVPLAI